VLAGLIERVTFHNAENGFCVLRAKARGHRELVTVIGHAAIISAGEWITATGDWVNDRTHGQQFKARFLRTSAPTSADGIEKYLSSGMIRGVGPRARIDRPGGAHGKLGDRCSSVANHVRRPVLML
jgi:exodeoxyribonuclease V alpha subunit